ncbi:MAG: cysteine hydrolase [Proteobacteria bacterium]|nr:cysteine hydrolase [Pseudomonadota bacterium]
MKPALLIVDMLKDTFEGHPETELVQAARNFLPRLNEWLDWFHEQKLPVVFACDSFLADDFIFRGRMEPHSLRGTTGSEMIDDLHRGPGDLVLEKRRFSAFFKTDLDQTLRTWQVDTVLIAGIATHVCVLATALDAVSNDFSAVILEDCCAAHRAQYHGPVLNAFRKTPLFPLLQVCDSDSCRQLLCTHAGAD